MNTVVGILAHVDAGKTTLAEALLYRAGSIRTLGRVDSKNTALDTHSLERSRGITIFSSQAPLKIEGADFTLLDTPGHVDFSAETERTLSILDYAILVISGTDGVQAHTLTLWRLLEHYNIPTIIFVTKMDFARYEKAEIMKALKNELSEKCIDYFAGEMQEELSLCNDALLEKYLESETLDTDDFKRALKSRDAFFCFFGSGLKLTGADEFLSQLKNLTEPTVYPDKFGAKVFKITRDNKGERLTHLKITGGSLSVREQIGENKISALRILSGEKYETRDTVFAGDICAVTGLDDSFGGQGLGIESEAARPYLEPVMTYKLILPENIDAQTALAKLNILSEEDPLLKFTWNKYLQQINVNLMGKVQTEILKSIVSERFDIDIEIGKGSVLYKETIEDKVEGVGHYEPLRHYAEVHLILEPLPKGSGVVIDSRLLTDELARNWQRLIHIHLGEKEHLGVLTGSPITDIKITLGGGRAHEKHTEGGDFRQATYRAVRHGLMNAKSKLLEPYYSFRLEIPSEQIGRAINDIRMKCGEFDSPEDIGGGMMMLCGRAPVITMEDYSAQVASYTGGKGRLYLTVCGYDTCHNQSEVIEQIGYNAEADIDNTADSVFCAHGAGFNVKWDKVCEYMHLDSCIKKDIIDIPPKIKYKNLNIDDKELEAIMLREFGPIRRREYGIAKVKTKTHEEVRAEKSRKKLLIIDGYNVIFAWSGLQEIAKTDIANARDKLIFILENYCAFTKTETVVVFDAYLVSGGKGEKYDANDNLHVVYTKENETGDAYIEKLIGDIGKNTDVSVVTSDGLIQLSAVRAGVLRIPALEFEKDVDYVYKQIEERLDIINKPTSINRIKDFR